MDEILRTAPAGFLSFSDDGTILLVNDQLLERIGYSREELTGRHLESILSSGGRIFYHTHFFPLLKMQGRVDEIYFSLKSKSGEEIPVLMNGVRLERDGKTINDCVFMRIQQRHTYEDEILRARKTAEAANAAKARFLSMMSHDLRTPLTAISGFADVLLMGMQGPINEEQRQDLTDIKKAAKQMMTLINDILGFAQLQAGRVEVKIEPVIVLEALARAESVMRLQLAEKGLSYERQHCEPAAAVMADPERLQQVFLNLLTNAMKFTPPGGTITVRCNREPGRFFIHVQDTGIGIAADRLPEIFDPFVQVHDAQAHATGSGVGLGLSISRDLTRAMGGNLTVTSEVGKGSVFTIELPT
jgi:PAS domain S-box-containing protein